MQVHLRPPCLRIEGAEACQVSRALPDVEGWERAQHGTVAQREGRGDYDALEHTDPLTLGPFSVWDSRAWRLYGEEFTVNRWGSCRGRASMLLQSEPAALEVLAAMWPALP